MDLRMILLIFSLFVKDVCCIKLLYTNPVSFCLVTFDPDVGNSTTQFLGGNFKDVSSFDFYRDENVIYWYDDRSEVVKRYRKTNSNQEVDEVMAGLEAMPEYLSVDWIGGKLYWIGSEKNTVEVSNLDGSHRKVLIWEDVIEAQSIALHPQKRLLFWTDCGHYPRVGRAGMDGSGRSVVIEMKTCVFWPNSFSVDYSEDRLYFVDVDNERIFSYLIDGTDYKEIMPKGLTSPSHVSSSREFIFWIDWKNPSINYCRKDACHEGRLLTNTGTAPKDFKVVQPERSRPAYNPCGANNGGCSHLCLLSPSAMGYSCACPVGIKMMQDGTNCASGPSEILLVVRQVDLRWVSLDTPDLTNFIIPLPQVKHAVDVTFDPVHGRVYWSDFELQSIMGAYLNGSGLEVVVNASTIKPEGVALDWRSRNLFWIDSGKDRIQVTQLDGLFDKVIIDSGLMEPRAITIDPMNGRLFWSDWGNQSKLEMSLMDGSERMVLVDSDIQWPNGLALDHHTNRLYWGDAGKDVIAYIRLDTMERVILLERIAHVFGLAVLGDFIYWSDPTERLISRANKETGLNRSRIVESMPNLMSLKAVSLHADDEKNLCSDKNGGCSHFCFMKPSIQQEQRHVCSCPDGLELLYDDTNCHPPHHFLVYATSLTIHRVSIATGLDTRLVSGSGAKGIKAVATDPLRKRIYWSYGINKSIHAVNLNPSNIGRVVNNVEADDMAIDYLSNHLYWLDILTNRIEMMKLEDRSRKVIIWKNLQPGRLAVDPLNGWLFFTNIVNDTSIIEKSRLNGNSRSVVIIPGSLGLNISRISLDIPEKRLFWMQDNSLFSCGYDGKNPVVHVVQELSLFNDFGILNDSLFLLSLKDGNIIRIRKETQKNFTSVFHVGSDVVGMSVFDVSQGLHEEYQSACQINNGGCSHLCISMGDTISSSPSPSSCHCGDKNDGEANPSSVLMGATKKCSCPISHECTCPTHFTLLQDGFTCKAPESYLLIGQNNSILRLMADQSPDDNLDVSLQVGGIRSVKSMKHDSRERRIFWIDIKNKSLKSLHENMGQVTILMTSVILLDIALDSSTHLIYYTEHQCNCIQVVRYNATCLGTVVSEGQPKYLAIAPRTGYLFWTNRGKTPRLERSQLDGSSKITLINTGLGQLGPIEVDDYKNPLSSRSTNDRNGRIYWFDSELRRIESSDFEGNERMVVVRDAEATSGLSIFGSSLVWATKDSVEKVDASDGNKRIKIRNDFSGVTAITSVVADQGDKEVGNLCPANTCSHFCIKEDEEVLLGERKSIWRCSCPIGKQLVDNTCKEPVACNDSQQFTCLSNGMCIPLKWRCDQHADCEDKSDEVDCRNCSKGKCQRKIKLPQVSSVCDEDMRTCANMECISPEQWCDGISDCLDNSDETECPLLEKEVQKVSNAYYAVGLGISSAGIVLIACILLLAFICRQKSRNLATAYADNIVMVARPSPPPLSLPDSSTMLLGSGELCPQNDGDCSQRMTVPGSSKSYFAELDDDMTFFDSSIVFRDDVESGASESVFYDRGHITGASSSTGSALTSRPAFDPPPSPITDRSLTCISPSSPSYGQSRTSNRYRYGNNNNSCQYNNSRQGVGNSHSRTRKRRKKRRARHLPTPCSSTTEEGTLCNHYLFAPPPPTPLSGFSLSGDLKTLDISYPPSPSTARSLYPPPPPSSLRCLSEEDDDDEEEEDHNQEHEGCSNKTEK